MDNTSLSVLLKRMGYQTYQTKIVKKEELWYKPIAYMLFTIKDDGNVLLGEVWIINNHGVLSCFNKATITKSNVNSVGDIQDFETELYDTLYRFLSTQSHKLVP